MSVVLHFQCALDVRITTQFSNECVRHKLDSDGKTCKHVVAVSGSFDSFVEICIVFNTLEQNGKI